MYNLAFSIGRYFRFCCVLSLFGPVSCVTPPKHFLQGKIVRAGSLNLPKPFSNCGQTGRCQGAARSANPPHSQQRSWSPRQDYSGRKPSPSRFISEEKLSRRYPSRPTSFKTPVPRISNALPCDVSLSPDCVSYRLASLESDRDKLRTLRQPVHVMPPPPPKIRVVITSLDSRHEGAIDKEPDMDVLEALRKFGHLLDLRNPGEISQFLMTLIPSAHGNQCRINSVGRFSGSMDARWHLRVTDSHNRVMYSGYCLRESLRVDPGYVIRLTNQPYVNQPYV